LRWRRLLLAVVAPAKPPAGRSWAPAAASKPSVSRRWPVEATRSHALKILSPSAGLPKQGRQLRAKAAEPEGDKVF